MCEQELLFLIHFPCFFHSSYISSLFCAKNEIFMLYAGSFTCYVEDLRGFSKVKLKPEIFFNEICSKNSKNKKKKFEFLISRGLHENQWTLSSDYAPE